MISPLEPMWTLNDTGSPVQLDVTCNVALNEFCGRETCVRTI